MEQLSLSDIMQKEIVFQHGKKRVIWGYDEELGGNICLAGFYAPIEYTDFEVYEECLRYWNNLCKELNK